MAYDEKCYELAQYFGPEGLGEMRTKSFAQRIQDFIEDELYDMEREAKIGDGESDGGKS